MTIMCEILRKIWMLIFLLIYAPFDLKPCIIFIHWINWYHFFCYDWSENPFAVQYPSLKNFEKKKMRNLFFPHLHFSLSKFFMVFTWRYSFMIRQFYDYVLLVSNGKRFSFYSFSQIMIMFPSWLIIRFWFGLIEQSPFFSVYPHLLLTGLHPHLVLYFI